MASEPARPLRELPMAGGLPQPRVVTGERIVTLETLRALSRPLRLELLSHIAARGPICTCHLEESLPYSQPTIVEANRRPTPGRPDPRSPRRPLDLLQRRRAPPDAAREFLNEVHASSTDRTPLMTAASGRRS